MAVLNPQSLFMILWHFLYSLLPYHKIIHFLSHLEHSCKRKTTIQVFSQLQIQVY